MREELDKTLCKDFPHVFVDRHGDMRTTAMCWGFPNDGWESIIREAAFQLEPLILKEIEKDPEAFKQGYFTTSQIKEKYGTLSWYFSGTDEMQAIIDIAEKKSETTCETCGKEGKLRGQGWYYTACYNCSEPEDRDNLEMVEDAYEKKERKDESM